MARKVKKYLFITLLAALLWQVVAVASVGRSVEYQDQPQGEAPAEDIPDSLLVGRALVVDSVAPGIVLLDSLRSDSLGPDSLRVDSLPWDTLHPDSIRRDSVLPKKKKQFLEEPISGKNRDSLVYDMRNKLVYIYQDGDVTYTTMNLKADFMRIDMTSKEIYAHGKSDTVSRDSINKTRPIFTDKGTPYTMDTIIYNIDTKKAKIKGLETKDGEGYLKGKVVKMMPDKVINIADGVYTTCDHLDHPHFYLSMTKAKTIPGKKVIVGPTYLVMEDVPIYFLGLPFGFFPMMKDKNSGFIVPTYGEEAAKGFFLRNGGYYFAFNDYIDMTALGGIYSLGSWEASVASRYIKRYRYSGNLNVRYTKDIMGDKGQADYVNQANYSVQWTHTQDPKFKPNSTFAASVNFSSSGYSKNGSNNMKDYLNTQTSSSISYSKNWPGKPFSFSTSMQHSQNSANKTVSLSFPNVAFNVSKIYPFRWREMVGKQRWYEKISASYSGTMANTVTVPDSLLFTKQMLLDMRNGINHNIPISTSLTIFKYLNVSPSFNYQGRTYFSKQTQEYDPVTRKAEVADTTYGFYHLSNYSLSVSASTKIYGMFEFTGKDPVVKAVRHVLTPNVGFSYTPDFSDPRYGYYKPVQSDSTGTYRMYSPWANNMYGAPGSGKVMGLNFGLTNTLEMKVRSRADTAGYKKISVLDNLSANGSYNFLADSMNFSNISLSLRSSIIKGFAINLSATMDLYQVNEKGTGRINKLMLQKGKLGRIISTGWSWGYSFKSSDRPAINDINSGVDASQFTNLYSDPEFMKLDPTIRRMLLTQQYYDFKLGWNFSFNYSINYSKPLNTATVNQSLNFNGNVNLTPKWGLTFQGGYDFVAKKITPGVISMTRDLHCWQMTFNWVPVGYRKSWSFNIGVKSALLRDLKWDKRSSFYDNLYENY